MCLDPICLVCSWCHAHYTRKVEGDMVVNTTYPDVPGHMCVPETTSHGICATCLTQVMAKAGIKPQ